MNNQPLREGGCYAIETVTFLKETRDHRLVPDHCTVVYADNDAPSHCERVFLWRDEQGATA